MHTAARDFQRDRKGVYEYTREGISLIKTREIKKRGKDKHTEMPFSIISNRKKAIDATIGSLQE